MIHILWIGIAISVAACSSSKATKYETLAYQSASPENRLLIDQGKIAPGMSIDECRVACPGCQFDRKFTSTNGDYELWKVIGQEKDLYLHVQDGRIDKVSQDTPHPPRPKKSKSHN